jgi:hypothetical protein
MRNGGAIAPPSCDAIEVQKRFWSVRPFGFSETRRVLA